MDSAKHDTIIQIIQRRPEVEEGRIIRAAMGACPGLAMDDALNAFQRMTRMDQDSFLNKTPGASPVIGDAPDQDQWLAAEKSPQEPLQAKAVPEPVKVPPAPKVPAKAKPGAKNPKIDVQIDGPDPFKDL